jgi:arylsulfatase
MRPALILLTTLLSCASGASLAAETAARPNVLIILADDLGFSDIGCYGSEIKTPNIDRLAMGGLRFTQFYNTAKCHSSRISLLSGRFHR